MEANVPPPCVRRSPSGSLAGFSLVEICLALGIVAFALVPLVGLLAVGLDSYHNASLRGRSAQVVGKIASAIRLGNVTTNNGYAAAAPFASGTAPISWTLYTPTTSAPYPTAQQCPVYTIYFDENGEITTLNSSGTGWNPPQMVAVVVVTPPSTSFDPGKAEIAVAWPVVKAPVYTPTAGTGANTPPAGTINFVNPQGHDESTISFVTNSP